MMADELLPTSPDSLDRAIDRILAGDEPGPGVSPEDAVLADFAVDLNRALAPELPRAAFVAASPARLLRRIAGESGARSSVRPSPLRRLAPALVLVLLLVFGSAGVVSASATALPGDTLYGVKRTWEAVRIHTTVRAQSRATLLVVLADERLEELVGLIVEGRSEGVAYAVSQYQAAVDALLAEEELPEGAAEHLSHHSAVLMQVQAAAPPEAVGAIETASGTSSHGQQVLEAKEQGISPSELAPGQVKKTEQAAPDTDE
jgi:hypothetical protein